MKDNKKDILPVILEKVKSIEFIVLSVLIAIRTVYFFFFIKLYQTPDTYEYIQRNGFACFTGDVDRYRLPIYPMLIDIFQALFHNNPLEAFAVFQFLVSMTSLVFLYLALKNVSKHKILNLTLVVIYSLSVAARGWDKTMLTESLSLSLVIFTLWGFLSFIKKQKLSYLVSAVVFSGVGAFLRPTFAMYSGGIFGLMLLMLIFHKWLKIDNLLPKKIYIKCVCISLIPVILIMAYCGVFYSKYQNFTLSDSGLGQQISVVLARNYFEDSTDEEVKNIARTILYDQQDEAINAEIREIFTDLYGTSYTPDQSYAFYRARVYLMKHFDDSRLKAFVQESKNKNMADYLGNIHKNLYFNFITYESPIPVQDNEIITAFFKNLMPNVALDLSQAFVIGLGEIIVAIYIIIRRRKNLFIHLFLGGAVTATVFLAVFGTNAEFARTAITVVPMMLVSISMCLSCLSDKDVALASCENITEKIKKPRKKKK